MKYWAPSMALRKRCRRLAVVLGHSCPERSSPFLAVLSPRARPWPGASLRESHWLAGSELFSSGGKASKAEIGSATLAEILRTKQSPTQMLSGNTPVASVKRFSSAHSYGVWCFSLFLTGSRSQGQVAGVQRLGRHIDDR